MSKGTNRAIWTNLSSSRWLPYLDYHNQEFVTPIPKSVCGTSLCERKRCTVCYCSNSFKWGEFVFDAPQTQPGLLHQHQGVKLGSRIFRPFIPSFKYVLTPTFFVEKALTPPFLFGEKVLAPYFLLGEKVLAPSSSHPLS